MRVLIGAAGGAAALPGVLASVSSLPIIGIPIAATPLGGLDALLSIVQMPKGVPVATVAIGKWGAANAAILAAQIIAQADAGLKRAAAATTGDAWPRRSTSGRAGSRRGWASPERRWSEPRARAPPRRDGAGAGSDRGGGEIDPGWPARGLPDRELLRPGGRRPRCRVGRARLPGQGAARLEAGARAGGLDRHGRRARRGHSPARARADGAPLARAADDRAGGGRGAAGADGRDGHGRHAPARTPVALVPSSPRRAGR